MSIYRQRKITAHISPYLGGLAPETHQFVADLNEEAKRHKTRVRFVATANRIEAIGNLERAARSNTLGGWLLRRALTAGYLEYEKRPVWWLDARSRQQLDRQTDVEIESEKPVLRRGNSQHRRKLRKLEKNRSRRRLSEEQLLSPQEVVALKLRIHAETFYHLIDAIPQWERDRDEIYPADFRYPDAPLWWEEYKERLPGLGLRDYSISKKLLFKSGQYERVACQKAASPVWRILITPELTVFYLALWQQLMPPETQWGLERIDRLYRIDHLWPKWLAKESRPLFDRCRGHKGVVQLDPKKQEIAAAGVAEITAVDPEISNRDIAADLGVSVSSVRSARKPTGGQVIHLGPPAKRYAMLAADRARYNEQHGSYLNSRSLSKTLRERRSLNIPRETIEARNNMVGRINDDFDRYKREVA
jgi:hypothetical protein